MKNLYRSGLITLIVFSSLVTRAQVPILNSLPSASATLFLDFDGHTVANTSWNFSGPIVCGGSGLNSTQITSVFNRVAEDFRPFNLNVTTDSTKYWSAPATKRMRVILTVSSEWYGSAGGVSFVGSFTWGDNTPCFVFTALLNYNEKNIGEATSHETGHTMGLYHQSLYDASCNKISEYNSGVGSGEIGWAPIMGTGYYRNFTLWNNGPNPYGCNNLQSDLSIITTQNNFSYRNDDHNSAFNQATSAPFVNQVFNVSGVVEQNTDQDLFKFVIPSQQHFTLNATPYNIGTGNSGSDLDMQVTLFSGQTQLNVYNPGSLLNSIIDTTLNAGTYYLRIEGKGNVYAPNYASLGSYSLQGIYGGVSLPLRRLELTGSLNGDRHILNWLIDADEQVVEQILEYSTDGRSFRAVTQPGNGDRSYSYSPMISSAMQYRVKVTFDNGHTYYSNIVTLRSTNNDNRPKLLSNLVNSSITVTSPGTFSYTIFDYNGKLTAKGQLSNGMNTINSSGISGGMYMIRFTGNTGEWTDKFVKQ